MEAYFRGLPPPRIVSRDAELGERAAYRGHGGHTLHQLGAQARTHLTESDLLVRVMALCFGAELDVRLALEGFDLGNCAQLDSLVSLWEFGVCGARETEFSCGVDVDDDWLESSLSSRKTHHLLGVFTALRASTVIGPLR